MMARKAMPKAAVEAIAWGLPCRAEAVRTQGFGEHPEVYAVFGQAGHSGLDFGLAVGEVVQAAAEGVVTTARFFPLRREADGRLSGGFGLLVRLRHAGGWSSLYAHLSRASVAVGERVARGQEIGRSGKSGFASGPHLHFEVRQGEQAVDPAPLLDGTVRAAGVEGEPVALAAPPSGRARTAAALRVRRGPSVGAAAVAVLPVGLTVQVWGVQARGAGEVWACLSADGGLWCAASYEGQELLTWVS